MNNIHLAGVLPTWRVSAWGLTGLLCSLMLALPAWSAEPSARQQAQDQYRKERADCLAGRSSQDRQTCLKEAGAALAEARRGGLGESSPQRLADNARLRCRQQRAEDRPACERMAAGLGQHKGSIAEGAIIKEIVTPVRVPANAGPASAPASGASS